MGLRAVGVLAISMNCVHAWGQFVISAKSGLINHVEGVVLLSGEPVVSKSGAHREMKDGSELRAKDGRADDMPRATGCSGPDGQQDQACDGHGRAHAVGDRIGNLFADALVSCLHTSILRLADVSIRLRGKSDKEITWGKMTLAR